MWELDKIGLEPSKNAGPGFSKDEKAALKKANDSLKYRDGRFEIGIPWVEDKPQLSNNRDLAEERLYSLEKSLVKRPRVKQFYEKAFDDYLHKGYIRKVPAEEEVTQEENYLPHFAVVREEKISTKVRVVFDAAAKFRGKCINDMMYTGPNLLTDLFHLLVRFREGPVALVADITEMFLQVALSSNDRKYHRFLWRNCKLDHDIDVYEFNRLVFGIKASPFLAQLALKTTAEKFGKDMPLAAEAVEKDIYMDDLIKSVESVKQAIELRKEINSLLEKGGFHMRKWMSNKVEVLKSIPQGKLFPQICQLDFQSELPSVKTMGLLWMANKDCFAFKIPQLDVYYTKRTLLKRIASIFDPLQLLAPFTVRAKVLFQLTWIKGLDWDEELPREMKIKWPSWFRELPDLKLVKISRCLRKDETVSERGIHTFTDASETAFAAASYMRTVYHDGSVTVNLIAAKTRLAPTKVYSKKIIIWCSYWFAT